MVLCVSNEAMQISRQLLCMCHRNLAAYDSRLLQRPFGNGCKGYFHRCQPGQVRFFCLMPMEKQDSNIAPWGTAFMNSVMMRQLDGVMQPWKITTVACYTHACWIISCLRSTHSMLLAQRGTGGPGSAPAPESTTLCSRNLYGMQSCLVGFCSGVATPYKTWLGLGGVTIDHCKLCLNISKPLMFLGGSFTGIETGWFMHCREQKMVVVCHSKLNRNASRIDSIGTPLCSILARYGNNCIQLYTKLLHQSMQTPAPTMSMPYLKTPELLYRSGEVLAWRWFRTDVMRIRIWQDMGGPLYSDSLTFCVYGDCRLYIVRPKKQFGVCDSEISGAGYRCGSKSFRKLGRLDRYIRHGGQDGCLVEAGLGPSDAGSMFHNVAGHRRRIGQHILHQMVHQVGARQISRPGKLTLARARSVFLHSANCSWRRRMCNSLSGSYGKLPYASQFRRGPYLWKYGAVFYPGEREHNLVRGNWGITYGGDCFSCAYASACDSKPPQLGIVRRQQSLTKGTENRLCRDSAHQSAGPSWGAILQAPLDAVPP